MYFDMRQNRLLLSINKRCRRNKFKSNHNEDIFCTLTYSSQHNSLSKFVPINLIIKTKQQKNHCLFNY